MSNPTVTETINEQNHHHHHHDDSSLDDDEMDDDWEEWDADRCPFWIHCLAGSMAGVVEHGATYPLDTVRTHIQVCAACLHNHHHHPTTTATTTTTPSPSGATGNPASSLLHQVQHPKLKTGVWSPPSLSPSHSAPTASIAAAAHHKLPLGMWQTIRYLVNEPTMLAADAAAIGRPSGTSLNASGTFAAAASSLEGATATAKEIPAGSWFRLWRGVQTILLGCIPAHALYFSSYETIKRLCTDPETGKLPAYGSSCAGAVATLGHDSIMTPLDTIKQRMQLGHYHSIGQAFRTILQEESIVALYRSFPITLMTNVPYGMIMVTTNETCKSYLMNQYNTNDPDHHHHKRYLKFYHIMLSSSIAGFVASAFTTPLDRIKTSLQTQQLKPMCLLLLQPQQLPPPQCQLPSSSSSLSSFQQQHIYKNWYQAATMIYHREGLRGFMRGFIPRVLSHTPAVAISWTTYETAKEYMLKVYER